MELESLVEKFRGRRIAVVGDLVADQFVYGEISRVSREAPVLILRHERTETVPGGAANCAANAASMGARVSLVGAIGDDETGRALLEKLSALGVDCAGVVVTPGSQTTTKVRILAGHAHSMRQQVIRLDYEGSQSDADPVGDSLRDGARNACAEAEAVVVSDYNYGAASREILNAVRESVSQSGSRNTPLLIDSRFRLTDFAGCTSATPNEDEVESVVGRRLESREALEAAGRELRERLRMKALLITRGSKGMLLLEEGAKPLHIEAVGAQEAVDVTGAGDTVIAAYALALASGANFSEAARIANHAGGLVVMKRGTACVQAEELSASLKQI